MLSSKYTLVELNYWLHGLLSDRACGGGWLCIFPAWKNSARVERPRQSFGRKSTFTYSRVDRDGGEMCEFEMVDWTIFPWFSSPMEHFAWWLVGLVVGWFLIIRHVAVAHWEFVQGGILFERELSFLAGRIACTALQVCKIVRFGWFGCNLLYCVLYIALSLSRCALHSVSINLLQHFPPMLVGWMSDRFLLSTFYIILSSSTGEREQSKVKLF